MSSEESMKKYLQENVLTLLCFHSSEAKQLLDIIKPEYFAARHYRIIAEAAIDYVYQYKEAPGEHIADLVYTHIEEGGKRAELLEKTLEQLYSNADSVNRKYIINSATEFASDQEFKLALIDAVDFTQKGQMDEARTTILKGAKLLIPVADLGYDFYKDRELWLASADAEGWSTGIEALDTLKLFVEPGTLFMFLANANRGKSWALVHIAKHLLLQRKKVLHITLEMSADKTAKRYLQSIAAATVYAEDELEVVHFAEDDSGDIIIEQEPLRRPSLKSNSKSVRSKLDKIGGRLQLRIKQFPTSMLTVEGFEAYLEALEATTGFVPDAVIIDYIDLMKMGKDTLRLDIADTNKRLRGIAVDRNFALITASQANRAAENARLVTLQHLAEAYNKASDCDIILSYSQTKEERELGLARLFIAKARDSAAFKQVAIAQSYASGQFCISNREVNSNYFKVIDALGSGEDAGDE